VILDGEVQTLTGCVNMTTMGSMSIQDSYQRKTMLMLAWLGLFICLVSISSIHHHESGIHQQHACQLCALEELTTHGSAVSASGIPLVKVDIFALVSLVQHMINHAFYFTRDIRGSPVFS